MTAHPDHEAFLQLVLSQQWIQAEHVLLARQHPERSPAELFLEMRLLGPEHVQWAQTELARRRAGRRKTSGSGSSSGSRWGARTGSGVRKKLGSGVRRKPGSGVRKPGSGVRRKPSSGVRKKPASGRSWGAVKGGAADHAPQPAPAAAAQRIGEVKALSLEDLQESKDIEPAPTDGSLSEKAERCLAVAASNGFGSPTFLRENLLHGAFIGEILGFDAAAFPGRVLVETGALSADDWRALCQMVDGQAPLPDDFALQATSLTLPVDASIAEDIQHQRVDAAILERARDAQVQLRVKGFDHSLPALVRHFQSLPKAPEKVKPAKKKRGSRRLQALKQQRDEPVFVLCALSFLMCLGLVLLFFGDFSSSAKDDADKASKRTPRQVQQPKNQRPKQVKPKGRPKSVQAVIDPVHKPDSGGSQGTGGTDVEVTQKHEPDQAAKKPPKAQSVRALERDFKAILIDLRQHHWPAAKLTLKELKGRLAGVEADSLKARVKRLSEDLAAYESLLTQSLPRAVEARALPLFELKQAPNLKARLVSLDAKQWIFRLNVGGNIELSRKEFHRPDHFRVLASIKQDPRGRMAAAWLALLEGHEDLAHSMFRDLWLEDKSLRGAVSERLGDFIAVGEGGYDFENGRFVGAAGGPGRDPMIEPGQRPIIKPGTTPKETKVADPASLRDLLAATRTGSDARFEELWGASRSQMAGWSSQDKKSLTKALKSRALKTLKAIDKKLTRLSRKRPNVRLKKQLDGYREQALAGIFDKSIYPEANHGRAGQPEIDRRVARVREIWDEAWTAFAGHSELEAMKQQWRSLRRKFQDLGQSPPPAFEAWLERYADSVGVRGMSGSLAESQRHETNRRIRAFNKNLKGIPDDTRQQVRVLNDYRVMLGLRCLALNTALTQAALKHSQWMLETGKFSHESDLPGRRRPGDRTRAEKYGSRFVGENINTGAGSPRAAHQSWYNSSGHHRNMISRSYYEVGVGRAGRFWTQVLGGGRPRLP